MTTTGASPSPNEKNSHWDYWEPKKHEVHNNTFVGWTTWTRQDHIVGHPQCRTVNSHMEPATGQQEDSDAHSEAHDVANEYVPADNIASTGTAIHSKCDADMIWHVHGEKMEIGTYS